MWFVYALGSAVFAALTSILAKIGIEGVNSTLATAIRTAVVLLMLSLSAAMVLAVSPKARADIIRWTMEQNGRRVEFRYHGDGPAQALPQYRMPPCRRAIRKRSGRRQTGTSG